MDDVHHILRLAVTAMLFSSPAFAQMPISGFRRPNFSAQQRVVQSGYKTPTYSTPANCANLWTISGVGATGNGNTMVLGIVASTSSHENLFWVEDNAGNNYVPAGDYGFDGTNQQAVETFVATPTLPGGTTINMCAYGAPDSINAVYYLEVPGVWDIDSFQNYAGTASTSISSTATATAMAKDFVVSVVSAASNLTALTGLFTALPIDTGFDMSYYFPASTGSYGGTWTQTTSQTYTVDNVAFKPSSRGLFSYVQQAFNDPGTTTSPVAATFPLGQTAGNLNIVEVSWSNATSTISSVADTKGNSYQRAIGPTRVASISQSLYYATNIKGANAGGNTVTVTFSGAVPSPDVSVLEYRATPNTILDVAGSFTGNMSGSQGQINTNYNNELVFAAGTNDGSLMRGDWQWGMDFIPRQFNYNSGINSDLILQTAGTANVRNDMGGGGNFIQSMMSFYIPTSTAATWKQMTEIAAAGTTIQTPAFASNTTTGNSILCSIAYPAASASVSSVADTAGNSYSKATSHATVQNAGSYIEIWYKSNITGGSGVKVTATMSTAIGGYGVELSCHEYSGLVTSSALDQSAFNNGASAGAVSMGPVTTTATKELAFGKILACGGSGAGSGSTVRSSINNDDTLDETLNGITAGFTMSGTSTACWDSLLTTFKSN